MNKILQLLDEKFVLDYFRKKLLPLYPDFEDVLKLKIKRHKDNIWKETYHVVLEFRTQFLGRDKIKRTLPIFCSAHSDEPRKNVFDSLHFLWKNGFDKGYLSIPHPLFYSKHFQGTFYRGVVGENLFHYIREKNYEEIENVILKSAKWFQKLHSTQTEKNFNPINSRIETVYPGIEHIISRVGRDYPDRKAIFQKIYHKINTQEKEFFSSRKKLWLVHGDAHPENIIRMSKKKIGVIDFTDLCLSDFARDLGSFSQQLDFMIMRKIGDKIIAEKYKKMFIEEYFKLSKEELNNDVKMRMKNYYNWTAMRTATFFLIKSGPEPERGYPLIELVRNDLGF